MSLHEFDAYCDTKDLSEPPYHEQIAMMHEFETAHETKLKQQGMIVSIRPHEPPKNRNWHWQVKRKSVELER